MRYLNDEEDGDEYTLARLIEKLQELRLPPDTLIEMEGCDCTMFARALEVTPDGHIRLLNRMSRRTYMGRRYDDPVE